MLRKLYAFVQGRCREDRPDALANHELLLPGHLFGMIVKERLENWLEKVGIGRGGEGGEGRTDGRREGRGGEGKRGRGGEKKGGTDGRREAG